MLVSCEQLAAHANDPTWIVFDCRHDLMDVAKGEQWYREGHIPGAFLANLDTDLSGEKTGTNGRHPLPSPAMFSAFLARHGVTARSTVVAYDDVGGQFAARLWWLCRWVGLMNASLLDGGIQRWVAEARPISTAIPVTKPAFFAGRADSFMISTVDEVLSRIGRADLVLIDARAPERYRGEVEPIDPVAGHIPSALNRFYKENLKADLTFKSPDEIRKGLVDLMAGRSATEVVHQCGSGVTACANVFAMEYAGLKGSRLYAGSWSEWVADPSRPMATGPSSV
ncbi:MAG: sulfurtransferase [Betaproteobacteria bacterium]|jgi:thiosulfate/3-mercaptopyruvate sulfurtransferase